MRGRRVAAIAAAGLAVAAGSGVAIAATTGDSPKEREAAILDDAAGRLGVTPDKLRDALGDAEDAQLDAAVKRGDLTQEQADALKERRADSGLVLGGPGFGHRAGGFHFGFRFGAVEEVLDAAAKALGLSRAELLERFRDGDTVAEIAEAEGKQLADVRAAVRAAAKAQLDEAVEAGWLTREQADELLDAFAERIGEFPGGRGFDRGHGGGPGLRLGFGFGPGGEVIDAAAKALGLSRDALFGRLRDGDTLAEIAKAQGKKLADVRAAARTAVKAELDEAVADDRLTRRQANRLLDAITERIERFPADRPLLRGP